MKKMNLPNKLTMLRIILAVIILIALMVPWDTIGVNIPRFSFVKEEVKLEFIICGVLFAIASFTDCLDGKIARKRNLVTDFGKVMDAIADKVLVNGLLILLAYHGFISIVVPVVVITRDIFVDSIKMASGNKGKVIAASLAGKAKTVCMMIGMALAMFYNFPFAYLNVPLDEIVIYIATILSVVSGVQYYLVNKDYVFTEK